MNKVFTQLSDSLKTPVAPIVLYAMISGMILSKLIPTPANAFIYYREKSLKKKLDNGEITVIDYVNKLKNANYSYNEIWWILVLLSVYLYKGDFNKKGLFTLSLIGLGALTGVVYLKKQVNINDIENTLIKPIPTPINFTGPSEEKPALPKPVIKKVNKKFVRLY